MKAFTYPHMQITTMTVAELREKLAEYPDDMPVLFEWEGQRIPAGPFTVEVFPKREHPDACDCLIIGVDGD